MSDEGSPKDPGNILLALLARAPRLVGLITIAVAGGWLATFGDDIGGREGDMLKGLGVIFVAVGLGVPLIGEVVLYLKQLWRQLRR